MANFSQFIDEISVNMYLVASRTNGEGNLLISPISISYASMLIYLGSKGLTKANFDSAFKFDAQQPIESIVNPFEEALSTLNLNIQANSVSGQAAPDYGEVELKFANAVFLQNGLNVDQVYLKSVIGHLQAFVKQKNFSLDWETARQDINNWVEETTGWKVKDLIPLGSINSDTKVVLANALYFKAAWKKFFETSDTKQEDFRFLNGTKKKVDFMHLQEKFNYFDDSELNVQYLEIPYKFHEASLLVILPKNDAGLRNVEAALSKDVFSKLAAGVKQHTLVDLRLPKFKVESSFDAKKLLQDIGVTEAFTNTADLSGIVPGEKISISQAFHKTFIDVNEKGTEATAATAMIMARMAAIIIKEPQTPIPFNADHPFLFAIRHNATKLILFIGRVETL